SRQSLQPRHRPWPTVAGNNQPPAGARLFHLIEHLKTAEVEHIGRAQEDRPSGASTVLDQRVPRAESRKPLKPKLRARKCPYALRRAMARQQLRSSIRLRRTILR